MWPRAAIKAMSGIDIALWDLLARSVGQPLYKFLGGAGREHVNCYVSKVYFDEIPKMAEEARVQAARGFRAIKVQLGWPAARGGDRADVRTVRAIRAAVGPDVDLMLDANGAYDVGTAVRVGRQLEEFDIAFLEEPLPPDDLDGYAHLRRSFVAARAHAAIIPVGIAGTHEVWPSGTTWPRRGRIAVRIGEPIAPPEAPSRHEQSALTARVMEAITRLAYDCGFW